MHYGRTAQLTKPSWDEPISIGVRQSVPTSCGDRARGLVDYQNHFLGDARRFSARMLQLSELEELCNEAYDNTRIYKDKVKGLHDKHIVHKDLKPRIKVLLFNSRLKLFPGKLKSRWSGPFIIKEVKPYGSVVLNKEDSNDSFEVNGQRVKLYVEGGPT